MASENVLHLTDSNFESSTQVGYTLVDFWAEWCGPCLALAPTVDQLADSYQGKMKVAKIDVDRNQATPMRFGIRGIPTVILFKDGQPVDRITGNDPQQIKQMVQRQFN